MTRRERVLGAIVGSAVAMLILGYGGWKLTDAINAKNSQISTLNSDISENRRIAATGVRASDEIAEFAEQALPYDASHASHMYRTWLLAQLASLGFEGTTLEAMQSRAEGDAYVIHPFHATGQGDLGQVTELICRIESANIIQRVRSFSIQPIKDQRKLDFSFTTEVLSLANALERELEDVSEETLAGDQIKDYKSKILGRNLFGPANRPPRLNVPRTIEVLVNERISFQAEASDPDKLDSLLFEANLRDLGNDASFDQRSGRLTWTPRRTGEYIFTVFSDDNGFPSLHDSRDVRILVTEPKPVVKRPDPPVRIPGLEKALFAEITAITGSNGRRKLWVSIKSEGRTLKVSEGDIFRVGEVEGMVGVINARDAEIIAGDRVYRVELGQALKDASVIRDLTKDGAE
ncbi:MAG: hypothetical protein VB878_13930 [Pirellulaceae bacterium]